ncbi:MAG TPA: hypothetical protein VN768_04545, partial [Acidimicrobiales bacterium]|nr:hypothetical protein [Acidimicrobiales bacterium]
MSRLAGISLAVVVGLVFTACSSTPKASTTTTKAPSATVPSDLSVTSFNVNFTEMAKLKPLAAAGTGLVGVILPDETSSTRYVDFDAPYLTKAFQMAGYSSSDFKIDNALGVDATELADAQADITEGAKVLVFDPIDSTVGAEVQSYA